MRLPAGEGGPRQDRPEHAGGGNGFATGEDADGDSGGGARHGRGSHDDDVEEAGSNVEEAPNVQVERAQVLEIIEQEITKLPSRQREAFVLRYWQELDVAETASMMGCSEGSVKTHCSRAVHTLSALLKAKGVQL